MINKPSKKVSPINSKNTIKVAKEPNELDLLEELSIRIDTLVELLSDKDVINKKGYINNVMMRIHELSKAKSFDDLEEV
ncbi:MAG: hypothetical protein AB7P56_02570 [Nitrososphaeraceae archaeon]